jgi:hypothetical protein
MYDKQNKNNIWDKDICIPPMTVMRWSWTAVFPLSEPTTIFEKKEAVIALDKRHILCQIHGNSLKKMARMSNMKIVHCDLY